MPGNRSGPGVRTETATGNATTPSLADGRDRAIENAAGDWWTQGAMVAIGQLARERRGFTIDDVLDLCGQPTDPHYSGAVLAAAQRRKLIEPVGAWIGRGGRLVRVWWGVAA